MSVSPANQRLGRAGLTDGVFAVAKFAADGDQFEWPNLGLDGITWRRRSLNRLGLRYLSNSLPGLWGDSPSKPIDSAMFPVFAAPGGGLDVDMAVSFLASAVKSRCVRPRYDVP